MGKMNVAQFAGELGLPVELLLEQLQSAGVSKQKDTDTISEQDKSQLLEHLRGAHGAGKSKITLVRRETTAIKKADSTGKSRTIQVEVRKKRTVAPNAVVETTPPVAPTVLTETTTHSKSSRKVLDEHEQKTREEEARVQAELAARQAAEVIAKQERSKRKVAAAEPDPAPVAVEPVVEPKPALVIEPAVISPEASVAGAPVTPEGTLHKPALKPGDKVARPSKKLDKPAAKDSPWDEAGHKKAPPFAKCRYTCRIGWSQW